MARIETYPLDYNISINDYVIGTDGDSLNATKNYKVLTFLDYLGTMYNLNSTDLLFNYNDVSAGLVADGQVSTNNYSNGVILMSGVTNIYVSKVSAFGQLIDDIINTTGTENLTIMFTDMGNRNNLGIFTVDSTSDVNANVINMTVTGTTTVGSIDAGKVMGIRIGVGGGAVDLSGYVTLTTAQTITGQKIFSTFTDFQQNITLKSAVVSDYLALQNKTYNPASDSFTYGSLFFESGIPTFVKPDVGSSQRRLTFDWNSTVPRTATFQDSNGTVAYLSDVSDYAVETNSTTATVTFKNQDGTVNATPSLTITPTIEITKIGKEVIYKITLFTRLGAFTAPTTVKGRIEISWGSVPYTYNTSYNETIEPAFGQITGGADNTIGFVNVNTQFISSNLKTIAEYSMDLISNHTVSSNTNIRIKGSYITT